ncbi:TPA: TldD/PmbA family protein, partial [Candidatus Poribacteria bacterium]|nr:TldD/PmbA family protein [Candidatus Poribacteria bacterium]HEX29064.1 TldD/PmbA family protein [Candidatus Poribacteria bacterium]
MREFTDLALDTAKMHGATYADIRIIYTQIETVSVKNGRISELRRHDDLGFGIRVIADGAWGFSSSGTLSKEEIQRVAVEAVQIAKASATTKIKEVTLAYEPPHVDVWRTPIK